MTRMPTPPDSIAPRGSCDCHSHIFDAGVATGDAPYPLPLAPLACHAAMRATIGIERGVLVQPSACGSDHSVMIDAIARSGGSLCGVGLLDAGASDADFDRLDAGGIRALRFVEVRVPGSGAAYPGSVPITTLDKLRGPMSTRGWHAEIWAPLPLAADICDLHAGHGMPLVLDHLGGAAAGTDPDDPDFRRILRHIATGDIWVKLVLCRTAATLTEALAVRPLHDALLAANPDRLVWGTDFPFIRKGDDAPDAGALLDLLYAWAGRYADAILTRNAAALYRFTPVEETIT